ncbi:hypothetical protein H2203_003254 [Taxawa tesnikishii (nom. ined.)]|nr:hypothetical protein H2203_003254 [Dothideales sp. JES 119]
MNDARVNEEQFLAERRDSIDEAVEHYLHNPRLSRAVRHPTSGRIISFSDVGDPDGAAVIVCVGMGLTRYVAAFYDELAITLHLRLITLDRPGVGGSDPYPEGDRSGPLSWPDDVSTVCNHLGISHFSVLAHSAGAIYALATALILPHCVRGKVHLLAPWVPPSQLESIGRQPDAAPVGSLPRSQRLLRVLPTPFLKAANSGFMAGAAASLKPSNRRRSPRSPHHDQPAHYDGRRDNTPSRKTKKRPEALRRESLMLMDQVPPMQPSAHTFALATVSKDDDDPSSDMHGLRRPSLKLSATATPTEADFSFAFEALHAAEHAARERQAVYSTLLTERTWVLATQNSNPAVDLVVCLERNRTIGFRYVDITKEVVITHGSEDKRVPVENVRWIGEQMSRRSLAGMNEEAGWDSESIRKRRGGCEVRVLPGEGHGLMASAGVMSDVLSEIAADGTAWRITDRKE